MRYGCHGNVAASTRFSSRAKSFGHNVEIIASGHCMLDRSLRRYDQICFSSIHTWTAPGAPSSREHSIDDVDPVKEWTDLGLLVSRANSVHRETYDIYEGIEHDLIPLKDYGKIDHQDPIETQ